MNPGGVGGVDTPKKKPGVNDVLQHEMASFRDLMFVFNVSSRIFQFISCDSAVFNIWMSVESVQLHCVAILSLQAAARTLGGAEKSWQGTALLST